MKKLVLLRHGESQWNKENRFTWWTDVDLSEKWIDYLVFDWLASGNLKKIVLLEIKSWQSLLNRNESMVKNTVWQWLVSYEVFRVHI